MRPTLSFFFGAPPFKQEKRNFLFGIPKSPYERRPSVFPYWVKVSPFVQQIADNIVMALGCCS